MIHFCILTALKADTDVIAVFPKTCLVFLNPLRLYSLISLFTDRESVYWAVTTWHQQINIQCIQFSIMLNQFPRQRIPTAGLQLCHIQQFLLFQWCITITSKRFGESHSGTFSNALKCHNCLLTWTGWPVYTSSNSYHYNEMCVFFFLFVVCVCWVVIIMFCSKLFLFYPMDVRETCLGSWLCLSL